MLYRLLLFDYFLFLGDGLKDLGDYIYLDNVFAVAGNCDYFSSEPIERVFNANGVLIFYTHGHKYSVKSSLWQIKQQGRLEHADIVLFGHTHIPFVEKIDDMILANPGTFQAKTGGDCCALEINISDYNKIDIKPITINIK